MEAARVTAAPDGVAIRVTELSRRFGRFLAVDRVSFEVPRGQILGFLGPNGAGKSTTIRMLCGILPPTGGRAEVLGIDVARAPEQVKERLGYMSQRFSLYEDLSVAENIAFYGGVYGLLRRQLQERRDWVIRMAGLSGQEKTLTRDLSTGIRQRLALGCALLHEPPLLLLDEPTSGVDPKSRRDFWELIRSFSERGHTILVTTHYMDEAEYCDALVLINRGQIVGRGSPAALKAAFSAGRLIHVRCARAWEAADLLAERSGILDVALFGAGLHVTVAPTGPDLEALRDLLSAFTVTEIAPVSASLEDVFVAMASHPGTREGAIS